MADPGIDEEFPSPRSADNPAVIAREESEKVVTPLPKLQIGTVLFIQLAEPICSQCIEPFIAQVVHCF